MADDPTPPDDGASFESMLGRLESLVERLENEDLTLEQALAAYQEGVRLAHASHHRLSEAERRLEELRGQTLVEVDDSKD